MLEILVEVPGVILYGITHMNRLKERVPTTAFILNAGVGFQTHPVPPRQVAEELDLTNIIVWDGNYYALEVTTRLGVEDSGGMLRVGSVHYNTLEEIERFGEAVAAISR